MTLNLPPRVRQGIYLVTAIAAPLAVYAQAKGYIGDLEFTLYASEAAVVSAMAGFNVSDSSTPPVE